MKVKTKITAHAGCMNTPNDSMESVKVAVRMKADICEVDVSALSDGTPVLKHDKVLPSDSMLYKLCDVFEYVKDEEILLNLDIKDKNSLREISQIADFYDLTNRVFLTGLNEEDALELSDTNYNIKYYLNHNLQLISHENDYENYLENLVKTMKKSGCIGINSRCNFCTEKAVHKLHEHGLLVSVWTVDDSESMKKLIDMGVDNITTNRPELLLGILH